MRFHLLAVAATAITLGACAGGDKAAENTTTDTAAVVAATPAATTPAGTTTAAPITGTTHEVKMIGDAQGYRFEPANITVKAGDGIKFTTVSGGPHNVAFDAATISADVKGQLDANISEKMGELSSAMKMNAGESITVSFANIKAGTYPFHCVPHLAMGMKGVITVQ
ncbi:MAG: cupredoxin domain-containing protein [Gemmatimonadaceae bacterium]|nr:cupredoxin domain-containing protein [Gemmatimonadaceae bacterium]